jgi:uncharacterized protein (TIGR03083 family)
MIDREGIAQRLTDELAALESAISQLDDSVLEHQSSNELWTARDTLMHLIASEATMLDSAVAIADGRPTGDPATYDGAAQNEAGIEQLSGKSVAELLAELRSNRAQTLAFLRERSDDDLNRLGRTPAGRERAAGELVERIAGHQLEHLEQVKAAAAS